MFYDEERHTTPISSIPTKVPMWCEKCWICKGIQTDRYNNRTAFLQSAKSQGKEQHFPTPLIGVIWSILHERQTWYIENSLRLLAYINNPNGDYWTTFSSILCILLHLSLTAVLYGVTSSVVFACSIHVYVDCIFKKEHPIIEPFF